MSVPAAVVFTGAPDMRSLSWTAEDLTAPPLPCFSDTNPPNSSRFSSTIARPAWRSLQLEQYHLPTGVTPKGAEWYVDGDLSRSSPVEETSFLNTNSISLLSSTESDSHPPSSAEAEELISQFYEHSIALHEAIPSSQIVDSDPSNQSSSSQSSSSSNYSLSHSAVKRQKPAMPPSVHLSELREIPNATYLKSINPQTITVNLIVGLISISAPRAIKLRKNGGSVLLIEMTVGDETKAGFGINLWLPSSKSQMGNLQQKTNDLRPRDIIMIRNLALSSFQGNVYGQSLRKETTKVDLLYRVALDKHDRKGIVHARDLDESENEDGYVGKVKKVRNWVMLFVGGGVGEREIGTMEGVRKRRTHMHAHILPPDTQ